MAKLNRNAECKGIEDLQEQNGSEKVGFNYEASPVDDNISLILDLSGSMLPFPPTNFIM